jgi:hypothetical protein
MLFEASITIPAARTWANPATVILPIGHGVITKIMVRPRPGHAGVAHCVIRHHEHQIAPSQESMDFHGDAFPIDWEEDYEVSQPPYELKIEGWNDSTLYPHTFDVFVAVLDRQRTLITATTDAIRQALAMLSPRRIFTGGS